MKRVPENGAMDDPREVESYDQLSRQHLGLVERKFIQRLLSLLKSKRRPLVLDVGAGPGNIPLELARRREDARLVAVDLSSGMLRLAREKFRGQGLTGQFRVVCAHSEHLPFRDGTFDTAFTHSTLHHLADPRPSLSEIARVTAPGSPFLIRDLRRPPAPLVALYVSLFGMGYDKLMKKMYRESLHAGYTFREMRAFAAGIACAAARATRFFVTHVGIEGTAGRNRPEQ